MLQPITTPADLRHAAALLREGFPERSASFWDLTLARMQALRQAAAGLPQIAPLGQFLVHQGRPVGVLLTLGSLRQPANGASHPMVNLSSWYIQAPHRWQAGRMLGRVLADANTTFTDLTPTPNVQRMLPRLGMHPVNQGLQVHPLLCQALRPSGAPAAWLERLPPEACGQAHGLPPGLLQAHAQLGCLALRLHDDEGSQLLVLRRTRLRGLPAARLVFAESHRRWRPHLGQLARHLLRQGLVFLVSDHRPGDDARGAWVRPRGVWFAKGRCFADRTDALGSELCLMPH